MKKDRLLALIMAVVIVMRITIPFVYADTNSYISAPMSTVTEYDRYSFRGLENRNVRFNIIIDNDNLTGQFAIVYLNSPDYGYEYIFDLRDILGNRIDSITDSSWEDIRTACFNNMNE